MPWDAIIAGGLPTLAFVLLAYFLYTAVGSIGTVISSDIQESRRAELEALAQIRQSNLQIAAEIQRSSLVFAQGVDTDLRNRRIDAYQKLWQMTELLPLYPRRDEVSNRELRSLSEGVRDWYFRVGGIFMSTNTRDAYFLLQQDLQSQIAAVDTDTISDEVYERIRERCSTLRTELTDDLLSRRAAPVI